MNEWNELIDVYAHDLEVAGSSYEMMGRMLDRKDVVSRFKERDISEIYIYGGGYLGIQLYQAVSADIKVVAVIDRNGKLLIDVPQIPIVGLDEFERKYHGQTVIITSVRFYYQIQQYLERFVSAEQMLYLGELLGGIL